MGQGPSAFVVQSGHGKSLTGPAGGPSTIKAGTGDTNGSFAALEVVIGPSQDPTLHSHLREDEMWYIIDGELRFIAGDTVFPAHTGAFVFVPRTTPHCFQNLGGSPGRILVMFTPSGMERFFEEHAALPEGPADPDSYGAISERNWMTVEGPTLAELKPV